MKIQAAKHKYNMLELTTSFARKKTQAYYEKIGFEKTSYKYVQKLDN